MHNVKRIYWDACVWIALIKQEEITLEDGTEENRYKLCRGVLSEAEKGNIEIVTSALTIAEVCKSPEVKNSPVENLPTFFDRSYILLVPVDKSVGVAAQQLQTSGVALKPPDAIHIASARHAKVNEVHTFDKKILRLDKTITGQDGQPIPINKPGFVKPEGLFATKEEE